MNLHICYGTLNNILWTYIYNIHTYLTHVKHSIIIGLLPHNAWFSLQKQVGHSDKQARQALGGLQLQLVALHIGSPTWQQEVNEARNLVFSLTQLVGMTRLSLLQLYTVIEADKTGAFLHRNLAWCSFNLLKSCSVQCIQYKRRKWFQIRHQKW